MGFELAIFYIFFQCDTTGLLSHVTQELRGAALETETKNREFESDREQCLSREQVISGEGSAAEITVATGEGQGSEDIHVVG